MAKLFDLTGWDVPEVFQRHVLTGRMDFVWTGHELPPSEKFQTGGASSVRGYPTWLATGDSGFALGLEWQIPGNFIAGEILGIPEHSDYFYTFFDVGGVRPENGPFTTLHGTGAGVTYFAGDWAELDLSLGFPLDSIGTIESGDIRAHASLRLTF